MNSSKHFTCPSGKLRTKYYSLARWQNPLVPGYQTVLSLHSVNVKIKRRGSKIIIIIIIVVIKIMIMIMIMNEIKN